MSITVVCPSNHQIKVKDHYAGRIIKCPKCKARVHIPVPDQEIPGGLVRGVATNKKATGDVWEFFDDPSDEIEEIDDREAAPAEEETRVHGELVPIEGGDKINLSKPILSVGRQKSCDIVLRHHNISASHAQLRFTDGYWYVSDLKSTNGIKVNGKSVQGMRLLPGDIVTFSKREFIIQY